MSRINNFRLQKNLLFCIILALGIFYIVITAVSFQQIITGCVTLFLKTQELNLETIKYLINSRTLYITLSGVFVVSILVFRLANALLATLIKILNTYIFIIRSKSTYTGDYFLVYSEQSYAFTAGFFRPQIYISRSLKNSLNSREFEVLINHERNHKRDFDPLKDLIIGFIEKFIIPFPHSSNIFEKYRILTELTADLSGAIFSYKEIVRTLVKTIESGGINLGVNFADSKNRVEFLTTANKFNYSKILFSVGVYFISIFVGTLALTYSKPFNRCVSIEDCFGYSDGFINFAQSGTICIDHYQSKGEAPSKLTPAFQSIDD